MSRGETHEVAGKSGTISQLAVEFGIPLSVVSQRRHRGWDLETSLTTPYEPGKRSRPGSTNGTSKPENVALGPGGRPLTALEKLGADRPAIAKTDPGGPIDDPTDLPTRPPGGTRFVDEFSDALELINGKFLGIVRGERKPGWYVPGTLLRVRWLAPAAIGDRNLGRETNRGEHPPEMTDARRLLLERLASVDLAMSKLTAERADILRRLST